MPEEHGRLAFHPECPLCSGERLAGALPRDAVMGHRTQAVLAAGVLAFSTASPAVVLAQEPDQQQEGAAAPDPVAAPALPSEPGFDPGGGSTAVAPAPAMPAPLVDDGVALEPEPVTDEAAPVADPGDGSATQPAPATPAPPSTAPPSAADENTAPDAGDPAPAQQGESGANRKSPRPIKTLPLTTPGPPPASPDANGNGPAPVAKPEPSSGDGTNVPGQRTDSAGSPPAATTPSQPESPGTPPAANTPKQTESPGTPPPTNAPAPQTGSVATPIATNAPAPQTESPSTPTAAARRSEPAHRGDRVHVVRPGESLWSIAEDMLGDGASTAGIAREVNRLWQLNSGRIATGNPDLIAVGTELVLR